MYNKNREVKNMRKVLKILTLVIAIIGMITLTGCTTETTEEETNVLSLAVCMQDAGLEKSEFGKNLTYYYMGPDDISLYYVKNWKTGKVVLKRYFATEEQYNVQKGLYPDAKANDKKLLLTIDDFMTVENMDTYWNEIENSTTYLIVK